MSRISRLPIRVTAEKEFKHLTLGDVLGMENARGTVFCFLDDINKPWEMFMVCGRDPLRIVCFADGELITPSGISKDSKVLVMHDAELHCKYRF